MRASRSSFGKWILRLAQLACVFAIGLSLQACATTPSSPDLGRERASLIVVRSGTEVKMSWKSQADRSYTILYSTSRNAPGNQWRPLKGYVNMQGTGGTMQASQQVPRGKEYYYRLRSAE